MLWYASIARGMVPKGSREGGGVLLELKKDVVVRVYSQGHSTGEEGGGMIC